MTANAIRTPLKILRQGLLLRGGWEPLELSIGHYLQRLEKLNIEGVCVTFGPLRPLKAPGCQGALRAASPKVTFFR